MLKMRKFVFSSLIFLMPIFNSEFRMRQEFVQTADVNLE